MYTLISPERIYCVGIFETLEQAEKWREANPRYVNFVTMEFFTEGTVALIFAGSTPFNRSKF